MWNRITGILFSNARNVCARLDPHPPPGIWHEICCKLLFEGGGRREGRSGGTSLHRCDQWSLMWRLINFTVRPSQGSHRQYFLSHLKIICWQYLIFTGTLWVMRGDHVDRVTHLISGTSIYSRAKLAMTQTGTQTCRTRTVLKAHL